MDEKTSQAAAGLVVGELKKLVKDSGPLGIAALDAAQTLIAQLISEAYTVRFQAEKIEFATVPGVDQK